MHYPISMHEFVDPPKGGSSSFAPRHSLQAASALGLIHLRCFSSSQFGIVCKQPLPSRAASVGVGCQKVVVGAYREKSPDGTYSAYFPFGELRDVQLMLPFHGKLEGGVIKRLNILNRCWTRITTCADVIKCSYCEGWDILLLNANLVKVLWDTDAQ